MRVQKIPSLMLMLATAGLAGCPGDTPPPAVAVTVAPACDNCGAVGPTRYAGKGVGVWAYANQTDRPVAIPVSIGGLPGNAVTLVFSNDGDKAQPMPPIAVQAGPVSALPQAAEARAPAQADAAPSMEDDIRAFNERGWAERLARVEAGQALPAEGDGNADAPTVERANTRPPSIIDSKVGDKRPWYNGRVGPPQVATLRRQVTLHDGVVLNVWLEDGEFGDQKVSDALIDAMTDSYSRRGGTYEFMVEIGGPMWGAHNTRVLIPAQRQPVNVVLLRIGPNMGGYFHGANAFLNVPGTETARSNEAVAIFLNTVELYPGKSNGLRYAVLALAHESTHMQNFYRRAVKVGPGYTYAGWLDEGTAVMMQDFASQRLLGDYNEVRDLRLPSYLAAPYYGCSVTAWPKAGEKCDGYAVWGAWGGFLNRQLGMPFFRNLLNDKTNKASEQVLDAAIRSVRPDSGLVPELHRWGASVGALMPAAQTPARFGYPARTDAGFPLAGIDLQTLVARRKLPAKLDAPLTGHALAPVVRRGVKGTYRETVTVPPHTTLTVVIHDGKV